MHVYLHMFKDNRNVAINKCNLKKLHASARRDNLSEDKTRDDY